MPEANEVPLQFRNRQTLEVQKRFSGEIEHAIRAFSTILNGEGKGSTPSEKDLGEVRNAMQTMKEAQRSLPTDPLDRTRRQDIETNLLIASSMIWKFLSEDQRREFFPQEANVA